MAYHLFLMFAEADAVELSEANARAAAGPAAGGGGNCSPGSVAHASSARRARAQSARPRRRMPQRVCFVWSSRERAALTEWFPELVLAMAGSARFDVQLFCSAPGPEGLPGAADDTCRRRVSSGCSAVEVLRAPPAGNRGRGGSPEAWPPHPPAAPAQQQQPAALQAPPAARAGRAGRAAGGAQPPQELTGLIRAGRPDLDAIVAAASTPRAQNAAQQCLGAGRAAVLACGPETLMAGAQVSEEPPHASLPLRWGPACSR